jgi:hypothetical protein
MKCSHAVLAYISGAVWLAVGIFLMQLGISLLLTEVPATSHLFLGYFAAAMGDLPTASACVIAMALYIGYLKGKFVLSKAANKGVARIKSLPNPVSVTSIYSRKYYVLLLGMMGLGMVMKVLGLPNDLRGAIDIAVGAALISGACSYFAHGREMPISVPAKIGE